MERIAHDLVQGSEPWAKFRLEHHGASEAAAMLGLSKNTTRSELLRMKHTGIAKEFSDFVQSRILDYGHEVEALVRPMVEALIDDELYPVTYSYGKLSASSDGLTMSGETAFECKQWNAELAAAVARGELPDEHQPQCQQVLMVTGAERLVFAVSDGTEDRFVYLNIAPDKAWQDRIGAGWKQFDEDLLTYTPPEVIPAAVAAPVLALPAVSIKVDGAVALVSNLDLFQGKLQEFIAGIPTKPETDTDFADCKEACKKLKEAEAALEAAKAHALGSISSVDALLKRIDLIDKVCSTARLATEKLYVAQERLRKEEIVAGGRKAIAAHIASLNQRIGRPFMPPIPENFNGVVKGMKTLTSFAEKVNNEVVRLRLESSAIADRIQINLDLLRTHPTHHMLFADEAQIVLKANDDFAILVKARIDAHTAAEAKREEETRERIRAEEQAKAQREAEAKAKREADEAAKIKAENDAAQKAATAQVDTSARVASSAQVAPDTGERGNSTATVAAPLPVAQPATLVPDPLQAPPAVAAVPYHVAHAEGCAKLRDLIVQEISGLSPGALQQVLDFCRELNRKSA